MNRSGRYVEYDDSGEETEYRARTEPQYAFHSNYVWASEVQLPLPAVVASFDYEFSGHRDGAYVFESDSLESAEDASYVPWKREHVERVSARLVVDDRGFVRAYSLRVRFQDSGTAASQSLEFRVTGVNETRVTPPDWLRST
nr:hypothetical protein [Halobacterium wangiae]